ncbi:hypothetical protein [Litorilituus lipolyticus]|uniref:DUF4340 domain-containing protein n=1 Tax=Litorilituus lipolyticus TaxID=2491017 RepID=A0A502KUL7_9GAMM|nr:hypothetical protein [Litorilituus lipolyticus]TPH13353.1 hypothetical protein EPA86_14275 [Litorilituus lipolyticus]
MKLSRTGWNNVIIFSVMIIIIMINATNDKLFPEDAEQTSGASQTLLPEHSVILTLSILLSDKQSMHFARVGRSWQLTSKGLVVNLSEQQIEQLMFSWQQSSGLVQADEIIIDQTLATQVHIALAGIDETLVYWLYPLSDQLLIYNQTSKVWLSLPAAVSKQLLPVQ